MSELKAQRTDLEASSRGIARALDEYLMRQHGKRIGFAVFVFEFGEGGNLAYISNGQRADMVKTVEEWLARVKAGLDTDPPGPRAES